MKKFLIGIIIILISVFVIGKLYVLNLYKLDKKEEEQFQSIVKKLIIKDLIVTKKENIDNENDLTKYKDISFKKLSDEFVCNEKDNLLECQKDDNTKLIIEEVTSYRNLIKKDKYKDIDYKILEKDKIKTDIDLFGYIKESTKKNNIFTTIKNIKRNYFLKKATNKHINTLHSIDLIEGTNTGYILHTSSKSREIYLEFDKNTYKITLTNLKYFNKERIEELLNSIVNK